eukprot:scaffold1220_cov259-Pinguiococcus_pyrenoidosus.AAC.31
MLHRACPVSRNLRKFGMNIWITDMNLSSLALQRGSFTKRKSKSKSRQRDSDAPSQKRRKPGAEAKQAREPDENEKSVNEGGTSE